MCVWEKSAGKRVMSEERDLTRRVRNVEIIIIEIKVKKTLFLFAFIEFSSFMF